MDLTPKPPPAPRSWSLFDCCRPSSSTSTATSSDHDHEEESNEDIPTNNVDHAPPSSHQRKVNFDIPQSISERAVTEKDPTKKKLADVSAERDDLLVAKEDMQRKMAAVLMDLEVIKASNTKQVDMMQKQLATTQKSFKDVEKNRDELRIENESMQTKIVDITAERDTLLTEKESMQQRIESLLLEVAAITNTNAEEVEGLQTELDTARKMQHDAKDDAEITRLKNDLGCAHSTLTETSSLRDKLPEENAMLHKQVDSLQITVKEITAERKLTLGNLQLELELARDQLEDVEGDKKKLVRDLEDCHGRMEKADETIEQLSTQLKDVQTEKDKLLKDSTDMAVSLDKMKRERDDLIREYEELAQDVERTTAEMEKNLTLAIDVGKNEREQFEAKIASLESDLLQSNQLVKTLNGSHAEALLLAEEKNALANQKEELAQRVESLLSEVEAANEGKTSLSTELNDAREAASQVEEQLNSKIESLETSLIESKEGAAAKVAEVESLQKELETVQKSLSETATRGDKVMAEKTSVQQEIIDITNLKDELLAEKGSMQLKLESLQNEAADKVKVVEKIQKDLETATTERDRLLAEEGTLQNQVDTLESKVSEITAAKEAEIATLRKELQEVRSCLFDDTTNWGKPNGEQSAESDEYLKEQIETLQSDMSKMTSVRDELTVKNNTLEEQIESISSARETEVGNLQGELKSVQKLLDGSKETTSQLTNQLADYRTRAERAENSTESLSAQLNAAQAECDKMKDEIAKRLDEMIDQKEAEVEMAHQIESLTTEVEQTNGKCAAISAELNNAKLAAAQMQDHLSASVKSLELDLHKAKQDVAAKMKAIESLQKQLEAVSSSKGGTTTKSVPFLAKQSESLLGMTAVEKADDDQSDAHLLEDIFSMPPTEPVPSEIKVHGFSHQGLTVEFKCTKPDILNQQESVLVAKFINTTHAPLERLHLQVAVPKYIKMNMKPSTSTTVPVLGTNSKEVTQTIRVTNTMLGTKNLRLKLNASFVSNGVKIQHMATCEGFPPGQF